MNHATGVDLMAARGAVSPTASAIRLQKNPKAFFLNKKPHHLTTHNKTNRITGHKQHQC